MNYLIYEVKNQIGLLTINRPKVLNALNSGVIAELDQILDGIAASGIRCLIVTGAGEKAFVAGADIAEMKDFTAAEAAAFSGEGNAVIAKLESLPCPTIAAVNGFALGGGCELALACDIRAASETAVFGFPETSLGIIPGYGGVQRLARLVGISKAKELVFTCGRISAGEAQVLGLVNMTAQPTELMAACMVMAGKIAKNAPVAVRAAKKVVNLSVGKTLSASVCLEAKPFASCFKTQDQKEAMNAFLEKRKHAPFTGA
uniref:Putative 3-hydroxybutyryl-CoA dehydratase n=1 Tax=termite gut metagenome TaxID=433724 RepID=S0DG09_9ZZZZ